MTGPPSSGHLDVDALADVLAGERAGDRHLRGCAACSDRLAELAEAEVGVAAALATLPAPALPDGLSERLASALRAEAAQTATTGSAPAAGSTARSATVTPLSRRRRRTSSWLPAAAAGVALVLAGGFGLRALTVTGGDEASTDSAAAGGAAEESQAESSAQDGSLAALSASSGTDYAVEAERTAALPRLLADGGRSVDRMLTSTSAGPQPAAPQAPEPVPASSSLPGPDVADRAAAAPSLDRLRDPGALAECLAAIERDGSPATRPLSLDYAAYDGAPALSVVQPSDDPAVLVLTVVGPGCSGADPDTLLRTRLARP